MLNDSQLRRAWGPRCSGSSVVVTLHGGGRVAVHPLIVDAVRALNTILVLFNYLTIASQTGAYACRAKVGGNGDSIHSFKIALDINWILNPFGPRLVTNMSRAMVDAILAIRTMNGQQVWTWGGDWDGNKDAMHFQIACSPRDLATGIDPRTLPASTHPQPPPPNPSAESEEDEEDMADFYTLVDEPTMPGDLPKGSVVKVTASTWCWLNPEAWSIEMRLLVIRKKSTTPAGISQADMRAIRSATFSIAAMNSVLQR